MMQNAGEAYVLADSSKAKPRAIVKYAEWKELTGLLTDDQLDRQVLSSLKKELNVIVVDTKEEE